MNGFSIKTWKIEVFVQICIFPTLTDDSAMHWPALRKNPFSSFFFFFFPSSIGTDFGSKRPPGPNCPGLPYSGALPRGGRRGVERGWGEGCSVGTNIIAPLLHKWKYYFALFVPRGLFPWSFCSSYCSLKINALLPIPKTQGGHLKWTEAINISR